MQKYTAYNSQKIWLKVRIEIIAQQHSQWRSEGKQCNNQ